MTWTMLTSLSFLLIMFRIHFWSPSSSTDEPHDKPFSFQEVSRAGDLDRNSGGSHPFGVARLGDVEPPRFPPFDGFHEGALEPYDVRHSHHGASALRLLAAHYLRLDIEGLQP